MFKPRSTKFLAQLQTLKQQYQGQPPIRLRIRVPDHMIWWIWNEFGTAMRGDHVLPTDHPDGYPIYPVKAKLLVFPVPDMGYGKISTTAVWHEGIKARHMVMDMEPYIVDEMRLLVKTALKQSQYSREELAKQIETVLMPKVKELIGQSFKESLQTDGYIRPDGRLDGVPAYEVFLQDATIVRVE